MKITRLKIQNYRTLLDTNLHFPSFYTAICGKNDSGKTNIVRAIRGLMQEDEPFLYPDESSISLKNDFPKWLPTTDESRITIALDVVINSHRDTGLYNFLKTYLALNTKDEELHVSVEVSFGKDPEEQVSVKVGDAMFRDIKAEEVLKRLQTSPVVIFHSSPDPDRRIHRRQGFAALLRDLSGESVEQVASMKANVNRGLAKIAKTQQKQIEELLGRLESRFKVGLSLPTFDISYLPFNINLGDTKTNIPLDDWGSGTKNRTLILMSLLRARQIIESGASASKITPVLVIEEPESFLHPSAQGEFGRVLQGLAEEFEVQVIATTHSPYMLSLDKPESNILLERREHYKQLRETQRADTSEQEWMKPFALALGVDNSGFEPWKDLLFSQSECILLVEGDIDKEYFELLRNEAHGENQLRLSGDIFAYNGRDNLKNTTLLSFIMSRYKKVFVTYDLDAEEVVERTLSSLGLAKKQNYWPIGLNTAGSRDIEGLVPDEVTSDVFSDNPDIGKRLASGTSKERNNARQEFKRLTLEKFKSKAQPGETYFGKFYPVVKVINKALS